MTAAPSPSTEKRPIRVALAGNPNSGKTTVFNALTGSHQQVGNWPGVTVERKEGRYTFEGHAVTVVDLPGTYALAGFSLDEEIAHDYIVNERPDAVVAVVDAANLERNLYLVVQLLELGARVILDLNMVDVAAGQGTELDVPALARALGVQVVETVASTGAGVPELRRLLHDIARTEPNRRFRIDYGPDLEPEIARLAAVIESGCPASSLGARWLASRLVEGSTAEWRHLEGMPCYEPARRLAAEIDARLRSGLAQDVEQLMIERRYAFVSGLVRECTLRPARPGLSRSDRIDRVLTNRWLGVPLFLLVMALAFQAVFWVGEPLSNLIDSGFVWLEQGAAAALQAVRAPAWVGSLLADGVIHGVGSVLVFVPNIALLFLAISLLEDSGYMARAAFVMDRLMHALGLHGKSFIPLMMGFGCCVPAVLATRTLESRKDRLITILIIPLMSCSARLTVYTLFAAALFPRWQGLVVFSLYLAGIVLAVGVARLLRATLFRGEVAPLIIELPPYHIPRPRPLLRHVWFRTWLFVRKAGTTIAAAVVVLWLLANLPWGVAYASRGTVLGHIGGLIAPVLAPAGFGTWQAAVALVSGIVAKELVVGTLGTLLGTSTTSLTMALQHQFTPLSAYAFLVMTLVYVPCVATIAAIGREAGRRWAAFAVGYTLALGWLVAVLVYQVGSLFGW